MEQTEPLNLPQNPIEITTDHPKGLKRGRKGKYNPKKVKDICKYIQMGLTIQASCHLTHINTDTYFTWLKEKPEFSEAIKEAEESAEAVNLNFIRKAREKSWVAAAWLLERRFPERYSLVKRHELSGPGGRPIPVATTTKIDFSKVDTETLIALVKLPNDQQKKDPRITPDPDAR